MDGFYLAGAILGCASFVVSVLCLGIVWSGSFLRYVWVADRMHLVEESDEKKPGAVEKALDYLSAIASSAAVDVQDVVPARSSGQWTATWSPDSSPAAKAVKRKRNAKRRAK